MQAHAAAGHSELGAIDADGLRMAALLATKLRFERLVQGSRAAAEWFRRDGRGFAWNQLDRRSRTQPTCTQRSSCTDCSAASSTCCTASPSSKSGRNLSPVSSDATKSARWCTNVCS
jgi:hypothetical protein